jgi:transposase
MVNRRISDDLKRAALRLRARGDSDLEICRVVDFSLSTLKRTARRHRLTGSVAKAEAIGRGRPRKLMFRDCQYLLALARHKPTLFLDEYRRRLDEYRLLPVSMSTIHMSFRRAGLSVKRVQKMASERDPQQRAAFIRRIGQYPTDYLVCLDEVSKDDRTYARLWGRAAEGQRVEKHDPFVRKRRLSMVAALALDEGIIASRVVEGSFTRKTFMEYLRDDVVSTQLSGPKVTNGNVI